ncbi:MAG: Mrp/NBP35 family ATP-binding protein [Pseudomonadota bacterium]
MVLDTIKGLLGGKRTDSSNGLMAAINEVIDPLSGLPIGQTDILSDPSLQDGRLLLTLTVAPEQVSTYAPVRDALEAVISNRPEVERAFIVLTTEAPAQRTVPASSVKPDAARTGAEVRKPLNQSGGSVGRIGKNTDPKDASPARTMGGVDYSEIGAIIAVASGKGGVGKSTTTANLAVAFASMGLKVGVLDADVYGPSIPRLFGVTQPPIFDESKRAQPPVAFGAKVMSMGFLIEEGAPMVWRAPMVVSALRQLLSDVVWAPLDVLLIDMPPGTGDTQLTISQRVPLDGAIIVSTPQDLALIDARKGVAMFEKVEVPVLGIVENMSVFVCPNCGTATPIFGHGGARADAARFGVPFLGEIPLHLAIRETSDAGTPIVAQEPDGPHAGAYKSIATAVYTDIKARQAGGRKPPSIIIEDELDASPA